MASGSNAYGAITGADGADGVDGADGAQPGLDGIAGTDGQQGESASNIVVGSSTFVEGQAIDLTADGGYGGYGGSGGNGATGQVTAYDQSGEPASYGPGGDGGDTGHNAAGGAAAAELENASADLTGTGQVMVNATSGVPTEPEDRDNAAGTGGYAGYDYSDNEGDVYAGSAGGDGGDGESGANGGDATATLSGNDFLTSDDLSITVAATAGSGASGTDGGRGNQGAAPSNGGKGGDGGDGGTAIAEISGNSFADPGAGLYLYALADPGTGGAGSTGGEDGMGSVGTITTYGMGGNGGNGGSSGDASAIVTLNTVTDASIVQIAVSAISEYAGDGGTGGFSGETDPPNSFAGAPSSDGTAGNEGTIALSITDNHVSVSGGGASVQLGLSASSYTGGQLQLTTANLTFTGNVFHGDGASELDLFDVLSGDAIIDVKAGALSIGGSPENNTITGFATFAASQGSDLIIDGSGTQYYELRLDVGTAQVDFTPGHGNDTVHGFGSGGVIDLEAFGSGFQSFAAVQAATTDAPGGAVIATPDGGSVLLANVEKSDLVASEFAFAVACYCRGTLIATPLGERAIEALQAGDLVSTLANGDRRIRWIGRRSYDPRFAALNRDVLPVLIRAGALGTGLPRRDLRVSPKHAMFLDSALIPAEHLVNGRSITRAENMPEISYFHIELETHDVILAEGAPSETFVDCGNRGMFQNAGDIGVHQTGEPAPSWTFCAARVERGPVLHRVRTRLGVRARAFTRPTPLTVSLAKAGTSRATVGAATTEVRLLSPALTVQGDCRRLGVAVRRITLGGEAIAIGSEAFERGFHATESSGGDPWRWTDGDATLRVAPAEHPREIVIEVVAAAAAMSTRAA